MSAVEALAVKYVVDTTVQVGKDHYNLVTNVRDNIKELQRDLVLLEGLITDIAKKDHGSDYVDNLVRQIKSVINDAEDAVGTYVVQAAVHKSKSWVKKFFLLHIVYYQWKLRGMGKKIRKIMVQAQRRLTEAKGAGLPMVLNPSERRLTESSMPKEDPIVEEEEHVVGFDEAITNVSQLLTGGSEKLEVISIVGMPGLGKTTVAKKVFKQQDVDSAYMIQVFVYISATYERKNVFLKILNSFTIVDERVNQMSEHNLGIHLCNELKGKQYLIILDDIWKKADWDKLKLAFPKNDKRCRIVITTRFEIVANYASNPGTVYGLDLLPIEKSRELLRWKVFRSNDELHSNLSSYEEQIALKCYGLPLEIVVIAGIIFNHRYDVDWWKNIAESVKDYKARDQERTTKVIELMYKNLPNHLKLCFMYMGLFPEDYEIPVWKLVQLWLAEGLVKKEGHFNFEYMAERYLEELVCRNVVMVGHRRSNDKIKTCILHDTLREFCKKEAEKENFFKEIKKESTTFHVGSVLDQYRRLCVNTVNVPDFIALLPSGKNIRSLLTFPLEETSVEPRKVSNIPKTFKLLRVLEIQSLKFQHFPIDLNHLILLKYIAISSKFTTLPKIMSSLWSLETLIVNTDSPVLKIEADIWRLPQFRHLHTNSSTILPILNTKKPPKMGNVLIHQDILTLSTIAPESCTKEILGRSKNLKKLGIRGKLTELFHGESSLFSNLEQLENLENLRLVNEEASSKSEQQTSNSFNSLKIFSSNSFPKQLIKLTLLGTRLGWQEMQNLGMLENLEILKIKDYAFEGKKWQTKSDGFPQLRHLHIGTTDLELWEASAHDFPSLKYLEVYFCYKLKAIPGDFANIPTLQSVSLHCTNNDAKLSALELQRTRGMTDDQVKVSVCISSDPNLLMDIPVA